MWGAGPFEQIQASILDVHELVVERLSPVDGLRYLDVACGTGQLAELARRAGAEVTAVDFAPVLVETAKERAAAQGLDIDFRVGDVESLEFADGSFDVVSSTFGQMFAPDQEATARELARVTRPGGRIALANWVPDGGVGSMFTMIAAFQPPPPPEAGKPLDWGGEEHVRALLGRDFDLSFERHVTTHRAESPEEYWRLFSTSFGPVKTLYESLGERGAELHDAWNEFFAANFVEDGKLAHHREYLLVLGTRL